MGTFLAQILRFASFLFIARALLSWIRIGNDSPFYPIVAGIHRLTEPVLAPVRNLMPKTGGIDLSVIVVILGINLLLIPIALQLN